MPHPLPGNANQRHLVKFWRYVYSTPPCQCLDCHRQALSEIAQAVSHNLRVAKHLQGDVTGPSPARGRLNCRLLHDATAAAGLAPALVRSEVEPLTPTYPGFPGFAAFG